MIGPDRLERDARLRLADDARAHERGGEATPRPRRLSPEEERLLDELVASFAARVEAGVLR